MFTPSELAQPLMGGPRGRYVGAPNARFSTGTAVALLVLLALNLIAGVLKAVPCLNGGYALPGAAFRVCYSPLAVALGAPPGPTSEAVEQLRATSVLTDWFVSLMGSAGGSAVGDMWFVLAVNAVAWTVTGCLLFRVCGQRQWLVYVVMSPLIALTLGQSLDPVAIALAVGAWVLLMDTSNASNAPVAGALMAVAVLTAPVAVVVTVSLGVWLVLRAKTSDALVFSGVTTIVLGLVLMLDARLIGRVQLGVENGVTSGSIASILTFDIPRVWLVSVSLAAWIVACAVTVWLYRKVRPVGTGAVGVGPVGTGPVGTGSAGLAVVVTALVGWGVVLLPSSPVQVALWLVPFVAFAVSNAWLHVAWNLGEVALFVAVNLHVAQLVESSKGLATVWLVAITILRLALVGLVVTYAMVRLKNSAFARA